VRIFFVNRVSIGKSIICNRFPFFFEHLGGSKFIIRDNNEFHQAENIFISLYFKEKKCYTHPADVKHYYQQRSIQNAFLIKLSFLFKHEIGTENTDLAA
jgi:hypothetical protein